MFLLHIIRGGRSMAEHKDKLNWSKLGKTQRRKLSLSFEFVVTVTKSSDTVFVQSHQGLILKA